MPDSQPRILARLDADLERRIVRAMHWAFWVGVLAGGSAAVLALLGVWIGFWGWA